MSSDIADEGVKFEELENVIIDTNTERYFQIRVQLPPQEKEELLTRKKQLL